MGPKWRQAGGLASLSVSPAVRPLPEVAVVGKTSVRLSPEISRILEAEARRLSGLGGENVTVSELIRACIVEKFPGISVKAGRENAALAELRNEVFRLRGRVELFALDVEKLVKTLSDLFPQLATREQVNAITDGIVAVIESAKGG